jgi:dUTPase
MFLSSVRSITTVYLQDTESIYLQLLSRSGLASKGILVVGGVVDLDYTIENDQNNEIKVCLMNTINMPHQVIRGQRIAQATWMRVFKSLEITTTGAVRRGGFGSTGN